MLADDPDGKQLVEAIDQHAEERRRTFVTGFVRFVIDRGSGATAPAKDGAKPESWQAVGRRLYGTSLFNDTLQRELAARKEKADAPGQSVPSIRADQAENAGKGRTPGGGKDLRGKDHKQPRRRGPASPAP